MGALVGLADGSRVGFVVGDAVGEEVEHSS